MTDEREWEFRVRLRAAGGPAPETADDALIGAMGTNLEETARRLGYTAPVVVIEALDPNYPARESWPVAGGDEAVDPVERGAPMRFKMAPFTCPNCDHELLVDSITVDTDIEPVVITPRGVFDRTAVDYEMPGPAWAKALGYARLVRLVGLLDRERRLLRGKRLVRWAAKVAFAGDSPLEHASPEDADA